MIIVVTGKIVQIYNPKCYIQRVEKEQSTIEEQEQSSIEEQEAEIDEHMNRKIRNHHPSL